eukprot:3195783-Ditylum_brightwellii.AAC.1
MRGSKKGENMRWKNKEAMRLEYGLNPSVYLQEINKDAWKMTEDYPLGKKYNKVFDAQQVDDRRRPMRVKLFAKVISIYTSTPSSLNRRSMHILKR